MQAIWWRIRPMRPDIGFGAFISYSGAQDRELIMRLQNGIEKLAKRWYRPPTTRVFVDKTSIAAGPKLWSRIEYGLTRAQWLILMASPEAAQSWWVTQEVEWWLAHRSLDNVIIVHTAGYLSWDRNLKDFSAETTAIPPCLRGKFDDEPVWVSVPRTERGPVVEAAVLNIAAAVRKMPIHELSSKAYREHRRTLRWAGGAIAVLSLLLVVAVSLSIVAVVQKRHADEQAKIALSRQLASTSAVMLSTNPRAALLLAVSAYRINANPQTLAALMRADTDNPQLVRYFTVGSPVTELTGSGDGKVLVAGLADGRVLRWGIADSEPTTVIRLSSAIASLGVAADASVIAASDKSTAGLWRSGHDWTPLPVPPGQVANAVTVSPSGRTVVVNSLVPNAFEGDEANVVFDVATASQRAVHPNAGTEIETSYLVASSDDDLLLFDAAYGRWQHRRIPDWALTSSGSVQLGVRQKAGEPAANGDFVAATNGANVVPVWRVNGPHPSDAFNPDLTAQAAVTQADDPVALSPDGTTAAEADAGSIYVAPVAPAAPVLPAQADVGGQGPSQAPARAPTVRLPAAGIITSVGLLRFLGDGSHLLSAAGNQIALWDLRQVDRLVRVAVTAFDYSPCNACTAAQVSVSPDHKHVALTSMSALVVESLPVVHQTRRQLLTCESHALVEGGLGGPCAIPLWRRDGRLIVTLSARDLIATSHAVPVLTIGGGASVMAAALDTDEQTVVAVDAHGAIHFVDIDTGQTRDAIPGPPELRGDADHLQDADINSTANLVARVEPVPPHDAYGVPDPEGQGAASVYDLRSHRNTSTIPGNDITSAKFANSLLLIQRNNGNLEVWDERGTRMTRVIGGDRSYRYSPTIDRRAQFVARPRDENAIDLVDLSSGTLVDSIPPFPDSIKTGFAFSPDGTMLVANVYTANGNNNVLTFRDLSPRALLASACATAGSKLSRDEWLALAQIDPTGVPTCD